MRRNAGKAFLIISLIFFCFSFGQSQTEKQPFTFTCPPYLQNIGQTGITIMWMVNNTATSWVEYGKTAKLGTKAIHSESGMIDVNPGIQKIVLTGLESGTNYFYRVASLEVKSHQPYKVVFGDTLYSKTYTFKTPATSTKTFSFLTFNDVHSKPQYINEVVKKEKGFSFVVLNGDILGDINSEDKIVKHVLIPLSHYFATEKPFFLARGNHETRGAAARSLSKYIDTPTGKYYYSFTYGNTSVIVLDCGEDKPDDNGEYYGLADYDNYRMDEAEWLALEVQKPEFKNAKFKIVCLHMPITFKPPFNSTSKHGMADCSNKFAPILNHAGIDLLMAGHTHQFKVIRPQKGVTNFPIIVGGGPVTGKILDNTTYSLVEIDKSGIHCFLKKANGDVIEEVKIVK